MITWNCKWFLLAGALSLAGCTETLQLPFAKLGEGLGSGVRPSGDKPLARVSLAGGAFQLTPPKGWCIEPRSWTNGARDSFAMLASCDTFAGGGAGSAQAGYVTVAVGGAGLVGTKPAENLLDDITQDDPVLARDLKAGVARAQLDRGAKDAPGPVWRGVAVLDRKPVLVTVHAVGGTALSGRAGGTMIHEVVAQLASSAVVQDVAQSAATNRPRARPSSAQNAEQKTTPGLDVGALFGRLLNRNPSE